MTGTSAQPVQDSASGPAFPGNLLHPCGCETGLDPGGQVNGWIRECLDARRLFRRMNGAWYAGADIDGPGIEELREKLLAHAGGRGTTAGVYRRSLF